MKRLITVFLLACAAAAAQTQGVIPDWEVRDLGAALEKHTKVIEGLLNQLKPEEWVSQGAPALYVEQLKQAKAFNSYLGDQAAALANNPAKLSLVIDVFLRIEHIQSLLDSLTAGVRAHQNPGLGDLLATAVAQNAATREKLKEYTRELAVEREKEWQIANDEAQRCRASIARRPAAKTPPKKTESTKP